MFNGTIFQRVLQLAFLIINTGGDTVIEKKCGIPSAQRIQLKHNTQILNSTVTVRLRRGCISAWPWRCLHCPRHDIQHTEFTGHNEAHRQMDGQTYKQRSKQLS